MVKIKNLLENVNKEKRESIINSALKEFSENTFEKASTNEIVKNAGVSKGTLFHYFKSKEILYKYLEYFALTYTTAKVVESIDWQDQDIFIRIKKVIMSKFRVFEKYPYMADFSAIAFAEKSIEEILEIDPKYSLTLIEDVYSKNIDYTLFKEDVDIPRAVNVLKWTLESYSNQLVMQMKVSNEKVDLAKIEEEIYLYIDMLKKCFYK